MINIRTIAESHPSKPVLSPWAQKFGLSTHPFFRSDRPDGLAHSGLAPSHPDLPVSDYNLPDDLKDHSRPNVPFPANSIEADALFYAELEQTSQWYGPKSWQVPVINEKLYQGYPGGLQNAKTGWDAWTMFEKHLISVDESKWFSFFRKENWFDIRVNAKDRVLRPIPPPYWTQSCWWSVDNDAVWATLRISIELANRVLNQLIADNNHWLIALLSHNVEPITDNNKDPTHKYAEGSKPLRLKPALGRFQDYHQQTPFKRPAPEDRPRKPRTASEALELCLNGVIFYFRDDVTSYSTAWGITHSCFGINPGKGFPYRGLPDIGITIYTQHLQASLDTAANPAERCAGIVALAITVTMYPFNLLHLPMGS